MSNLWIEIVVTLLFSAFFSAAEIAFVSSNKLLFELENKTSSITFKILNRFYSNANQYISCMLLGNNIALVIYGLLMARALTPLMEQFLSNDLLILLIQSFIATVFILFAGEFIPKTIARVSPNFFLSLFAVPLYIVYIILYPFSKFSTRIAGRFLRVFGVKLTEINHRRFGRDDLDYFIQKTIEETPENVELDSEVRFFQNAMDFSQVKVRDCMVPRTEIIAVDRNVSLKELTLKFIETGFSKIIVYEEDIDNITGYIHSLELFTQPDDWTQSVVSLNIIPENMAANKLMKTMLAEKKSMVVVVDEFGGTSGIVTLEDLVEEIFGEIEDEHDTQLFTAKKTSEDSYVLSGRMEINRVNEMFDLDIPESDEYITVAGYILSHYQNFPKLNETVRIGQMEFKILRVTRTKIELVKLIVHEK
jgi:CBS domain containing-hemolysin-like protein